MHPRLGVAVIKQHTEFILEQNSLLDLLGRLLLPNQQAGTVKLEVASWTAVDVPTLINSPRALAKWPAN